MLRISTKLFHLTGVSRVSASLKPTFLGSLDSVGPAYDPDAIALFARFTSQPNDARKALINDLIVSLKNGGVWALLDGLIVEAAHDSQAGTRNWKQNAYNASMINSPSFTIDRGFTGDGSTSYLTTPFNPATAVGANYTRNSAHVSVWVGTNISSSTMSDFGISSYANINTRNSASLQGRCNAATMVSYTTGVATSIGWSCYARPDAANVEAVRNLEAPTSTAIASTALLSIPFYICASAFTGPVAQSLSTRRNQAVTWGAYLNDTQRDTLYNALNTYMTAIGAV